MYILLQEPHIVDLMKTYMYIRLIYLTEWDILVSIGTSVLIIAVQSSLLHAVMCYYNFYSKSIHHHQEEGEITVFANSRPCPRSVLVQQ